MHGLRASVRDSSDDILVSSQADLVELLHIEASEARIQARLNVVILTAENGNELSLVVGSDETVLGFTYRDPSLAHYASQGTSQTIEPLLTAYVGLRHHTEFPRRHVIPASLGRTAALEFLSTGDRPSSVTWEVA